MEIQSYADVKIEDCETTYSMEFEGMFWMDDDEYYVNDPLDKEHVLVEEEDRFYYTLFMSLPENVREQLEQKIEEYAQEDVARKYKDTADEYAINMVDSYREDQAMERYYESKGR